MGDGKNMLANNLDDVEEQMNFSFEGGATVDASMTVEPKWNPYCEASPMNLTERNDSFGNLASEEHK